jgi:peptide/nickel transport system substrate-binding protein
MKRKIGWLILSGLVVISLVLASCGPAATEEEEVTEEAVVEEEELEMLTIRLTKPDGTVVVKQEEKPRYGGTITYLYDNPTVGPDSVHVSTYSNLIGTLVNEKLGTGDITRGPRGTEETMWAWPGVPEYDKEIGNIVESWEWPDQNTMIFHVRPGIYFQDKEPKGPWSGREVTAEDVAHSFETEFTVPTAYMARESGHLFDSVEVTDKYTFVVHAVEGAAEGDRAAFGASTPEFVHVYPKDAREEFGDFTEWENLVGAGPWILTDYVEGSSITFDRNPNYWREDPFFPDEHLQLPYADKLVINIVRDKATRLAAMRTARADWFTNVLLEDAEALRSTNPDLQETKYQAYHTTEGEGIQYRIDVPEMPTYDIRVRQALGMAVDNEAITATFFGGDALVYGWPTPPVIPAIHTPLAELPEYVQKVYTYDVEGAKALLAEAGYPTGFQATILTTPTHVDLMTIIQGYWRDVGVEVELDIQENAVASMVKRNREHPMFNSASLSLGIATFKTWMHSVDPGGTPSTLNTSGLNDPEFNDLVDQIFSWENVGKWDVLNELSKRKNQVILESLAQFSVCKPFVYTFWQPWIKGHAGEYTIGEQNKGNWPLFAWVDQELKEEMGH